MNDLFLVSQKSSKKEQGYIQGFIHYLELLQYDASSLKNDPYRVAEFMGWLGSNYPDKLDLSYLESSYLEVGSSILDDFFVYLQNRPNKRRAGGLSLASLRNYQKSLRRFSKYLQQMDLGQIDVSIILKKGGLKVPSIFSVEQIKALYKSTKDSAIGQRDRVILGLYYGCGLRRQEGINVKISDILLDKNLLYVKHGKGKRSRYVPFIGRVKKDLILYLQDGRKKLVHQQLAYGQIHGEVHRHLLVSQQGSPLRSASVYSQFKHLQKRAGIKPTLGLHALRHSIATHLHQSGMPLTYIARFLGHATIESTQIYTHIPSDIKG